MPHIEATKDGRTLSDLYGEVEAIFRAEGKVLAGIKNKSQEGGMVDQRIIDHEFKFSIKREKREGGISLFVGLIEK